MFPRLNKKKGCINETKKNKKKIKEKKKKRVIFKWKPVIRDLIKMLFHDLRSIHTFNWAL
jgi:hypothetical protein